MTETDLQRQIQIELSDEHTRLLRNAVGFGWQGSNFAIREGRLIGGMARPVTFGLGPGSSDLVGPRGVLITPAMVGRRLAVFTAIEVKHKTKLSHEQAVFIQVINELGGLAGQARSVDEAREIVSRLDRC